jgi:hypothetical protein
MRVPQHSRTRQHDNWLHQPRLSGIYGPSPILHWQRSVYQCAGTYERNGGRVAGAQVEQKLLNVARHCAESAQLPPQSIPRGALRAPTNVHDLRCKPRWRRGPGALVTSNTHVFPWSWTLCASKDGDTVRPRFLGLAAHAEPGIVAQLDAYQGHDETKPVRASFISNFPDPEPPTIVGTEPPSYPAVHSNGYFKCMILRRKSGWICSPGNRAQ